MPSPALSIIIPVFNRWDLTKACLESLETCTQGLSYEVLLIDDGSRDSTRLELSKLKAPFRVIYNQENLGFSRSSNVGAKEALAPVLCFLNNDTVLTPGWWKPLWDTLHLAPKAGIVGNIQYCPGTGRIDHAGVYFNRALQPVHCTRPEYPVTGESWVEWPCVTAACCFVQRDLFFKLGQFDPIYRNGFEDVDLCLKALIEGFSNYVALDSRIGHHVGSSPGRFNHTVDNFSHLLDRWFPFLQVLHHPAADYFESLRFFHKHQREPWRYNPYKFIRSLWSLTRIPSSCPPFQWIQLADLPELNVKLIHFRRKEDRTIFFSVTNTAGNHTNTGIQRVVRCLARCLQEQVPVEYVEWRGSVRKHTLLRRNRRPTLATFSGPPVPIPSVEDRCWADKLVESSERLGLDLYPPLSLVDRIKTRLPCSWLVLPELMSSETARRVIQDARNRHMHVAAIFYDAIPLQRPEWVNERIRSNHAGYMKALSAADLVFPISKASSGLYAEFCRNHQLTTPQLEVLTLPGEMLNRPRQTYPRLLSNSPPHRLLCVSTLEPRKNHETLLQALVRLIQINPNLSWHMTFCGGSYLGSPEIPQMINQMCKEYPDRFEWKSNSTDDELSNLYRNSHLTIFPSLLEGFGLPIVESLWHGVPCLCHQEGAIAETAAGGGCILTDASNPEKLCDTLSDLLLNPSQLDQLTREACLRRIKTWQEYATELLGALSRF